MSRFTRCPKCKKKGYYEVHGYDLFPERGPLWRCKYCNYQERTAGAGPTGLEPVPTLRPYFRIKQGHILTDALNETTHAYLGTRSFDDPVGDLGPHVAGDLGRLLSGSPEIVHIEIRHDDGRYLLIEKIQAMRTK